MGAAAGQSAAISFPAHGVATAYARQLLDSLGAVPRRLPDLPGEHPALTWARSGLMSLTGRAEGPPLMCPVPLAACADGALAALASLAPESAAFSGLRGSQLLGERAASAGLSRAGSVSPGGACRLLEAADGWIAVNLTRPEDWELVPAWLECEAMPDWESVARIVRHKPAGELINRCRLLGLAATTDEMPGEESPAWFTVVQPSTNSFLRGNDRVPLVVDMSSLWAGPLCSHLLHKLGARVVKVESPARPDGARRGLAVIFNLLNAGKRSVALDTRVSEDRDRLRALLGRADIVIEGSRPRAVRQFGLIAEDLLIEHPGLAWVSITGYGRGEPQENWVAYGDDAGVAAGLSSVMEQVTGQRVIVGDAIADPLTGLHAALAAWAGWGSGGGLYSLSLRDVVRHCLHFDLPASPQALRTRQEDWTRYLADAGVVAARPQLRSHRDVARALAADTQAVLTQLGIAG